ncbi:MAG TPA: hypothetical protein VI685_06600 [Candidatus Angelobacter sp.]
MKRVLAWMVLIVLPVTLGAQESRRAQLTQLVAQLQVMPTDTALREKIIKLARELEPAPAVPEEAMRRLGRGQAAFELAKSPVEFENAVREFQFAANSAPWFANCYFNLGVAEEKADKSEEAIASFKLYLLAAPEAKDFDEVRQRIYKLEYVAEQNAKQKAAEAIERRRKADQEAKYAWLSGNWRYEANCCNWPDSAKTTGIVHGDRTGNLIVIGRFKVAEESELRGKLQDTGVVAWESQFFSVGCKQDVQPVQVTVSPDQRTLRFQSNYFSGRNCDIAAVIRFTLMHE